MSKHLNRWIIIAVFFFLVLPNLASAGFFVTEKNGIHSNSHMNSWLYVGGTGQGNYSTIQEALDNASAGDTIYVYNGTYVENLLINTSVSLIGENKDTTIIDGGGQHDVIHVRTMADHMVISGFTVQHSGRVTGAGFDVGVEVHSSHNAFSDLILTGHHNEALWLYCSNNNTISHVLIVDNNRTGMSVMGSSQNTITHNTFQRNGERGVLLDYVGLCANNLFEYNTFIDNFKGVDGFGSNNVFRYNTFLGNQTHAMVHFNFIRLERSHNSWEQNYWDDWDGVGPYYIFGIFGLINWNFDWNPASQPYMGEEGV